MLFIYSFSAVKCLCPTFVTVKISQLGFENDWAATKFCKYIFKKNIVIIIIDVCLYVYAHDMHTLSSYKNYFICTYRQINNCKLF